MQSENMRRRRRWHDPVVDHPEDASCKNKRTGSLGMSRDSVLYRSPAYIDTNLCPPQAVLCICHIYIPRFSLSQFPSLSHPNPLPFLLSSLGFSLSHPLLGPLCLPLVYPSATNPLSRSLSGPASSQHAYRSPKFALVFVLRHPRLPPPTPLPPIAPPRPPPCVLVVRVCGEG